jgi:hypothetical protein
VTSTILGVAINAGLCIEYLALAATLPGVVDTIASAVCASLCVIAAWLFVADERAEGVGG